MLALIVDTWENSLVLLVEVNSSRGQERTQVCIRTANGLDWAKSILKFMPDREQVLCLAD